MNVDLVDLKDRLQNLIKSGDKNFHLISEKNFDDFLVDENIQDLFNSMCKIEAEIMEKWQIKSRILAFDNHKIALPNGTQNSEYQFQFEPEFFEKWLITNYNLSSNEELGIEFDEENKTLKGVPLKSGDFELKFEFNVEGEDTGSPKHSKTITLTINPDPKSLWKNIPSNENDIYAKLDNVSDSSELGDKKIIVSSKRGRSHQNIGSFRDDDFAFLHLQDTGWSIVAVSDGAGSALFSRKGSEIACKSTVRFFRSKITNEEIQNFEKILREYYISKDENTYNEAVLVAKKTMYQATRYVYEKIEKEAKKLKKTHPELFTKSNTKSVLDNYHSTLIFAAFKKFDFGYVILTFGVGDCPIVLINKDESNVKLLNIMDVGEFGGGTRFITQPDIFHSSSIPMADRFNMEIIDDFSYLFLMTDGIYDPKFEVEANLEKIEKWKDFIKDLKGENSENLDLSLDNDEINSKEILNKWMDFWSVGNHDDRTLAIIY